jgi:1,4-alpha-glucan branching enzyme
MITMTFVYFTGLKRQLFRNARLSGSWNNWHEVPMTAIVGEDGCPAFECVVSLDDSRAGETHHWGVRVDATVANMWAISLEVPDAGAQDRYRDVTFAAAGGSARVAYYFTYNRRLGAQKRFVDAAAPALAFAAWAPNARSIEAVFGTPQGYIADDGTGIDGTRPAVPLHHVGSGIWASAPVADFAAHVGLPYMFRIRNAQGATVFRTDIHSRWQIGRGDRNPSLASWDGDPRTLDGTVSCSVIIDQDVVRKEFEPTTSPAVVVDDDEFWVTEFTPGRPVPTRFEDLVIYELHVGALGVPRTDAGTLADAIAFLDYLVDLGINAIELLPVAEFSGTMGWGYGDTHHFVIESSAGGRDKFKHFVRECHRRGIAVIQDVVYNHYDQNAERAQWQYDSAAPEQNIYYWYEGRPADHSHPNNGYLKNGSSGWTPRFHEEPVRQLFISSAAELVEEFHVDGLRVDLTQAIHRDNALDEPGGHGVAAANLFGQKFLREWSRTLRAIRPSVMLIAEDHTGWDAVTRLPHVGGLGFDATWFARFYHDLIGDSDMSGGAARVLREAGLGFDGPLAVGQLAGSLWETQFTHVAYHESHDEAGNARGSQRTSRVACNDAPLIGPTRAYAEARCRVAAALSLLSAGTPMFFMGEEVFAQKPVTYDNAAATKEDLVTERSSLGRKMFRFYQDLIRLRLANRAVRSHHIDVIHVRDDTRTIAFTRRLASNEVLIVASLNNHPFDAGYVIESGRLPGGHWVETFNSDAAIYGGQNIGNYGAAIPCTDGRIQLRLPANGVLVLQRT